MTNETFVEAESSEPQEVENTAWIEKKRFFQRRSSQGWLISLLLGTGLGIGITLIGLRLLPSSNETSIPKSPQPTRSTIPTVTVADAVTTPITRSLNSTGTVAARQRILVLPQTSGLQIKKILVDEGKQVKAGDVLALLDDSVLQTQIDQAMAEVESDKALLEQKQAALIQAQANLAQYQATVAQARTNEKDALVKLKNYQQLATAGAISREQLDDRITNAATKTEAVKAAVASVKAAVAAINSAQANVHSAQADVRNSLAKVKQLQAQLAQTLVRTPVAGIIAKKNVEVGDVTGTKQLFEIIHDGLLELQALVPEVQLSQVAIGASVQITNDSDSRVHLEGIVREISPLVDEKNRKAMVKINLPRTSLLRSGMFARAAITTNTAMGIIVPSKAVLPQPDGKAIVFTLSREDTQTFVALAQAKVYVVKAQSVQVGEIIKGGNIEITEGLKRGDRVVTAGAPYLKDGDRVQVP